MHLKYYCYSRPFFLFSFALINTTFHDTVYDMKISVREAANYVILSQRQARVFKL